MSAEDRVIPKGERTLENVIRETDFSLWEEVQATKLFAELDRKDASVREHVHWGKRGIITRRYKDGKIKEFLLVELRKNFGWKEKAPVEDYFAISKVQRRGKVVRLVGFMMLAVRDSGDVLDAIRELVLEEKG